MPYIVMLAEDEVARFELNEVESFVTSTDNEEERLDDISFKVATIMPVETRAIEARL